jgi:hypothetical protein
MAKTVKLTKMAFNDDPYPTVSGSEGLIHINLPKGVITGYQPGIKVLKNLPKGVITGYQPGIKVLKGTYYCQTAKERVQRRE